MKSKGFTLIELLAVLVILAILALISIPITIRIINNVRENSYKRSIASYGKAFENYIALDSMKSASEDYKSLDYYEPFVETEYSGNRVECDIDSSTFINGQLKLVGCRVVDSRKKQISKERYKYDSGNVSIFAYKEYFVENIVVLNGEQYYVIEDSDKNQDYITLLKKYPLTVAEVNLYGKSGTADNHVNKYTRQSIGQAYNLSGYGGIAYYSSEHCGWYDSASGSVDTSACESEHATSYESSDIKYVVDNWSDDKFKNNELKEVDGYSARLINTSELNSDLFYSQNKSNYNYSKYSWIHAPIDGVYWQYWTMSKVTSLEIVSLSSSYAHNLYVFTGYYPSDSGVVRPVINVRKDVIKSE